MVIFHCYVSSPEGTQNGLADSASAQSPADSAFYSLSTSCHIALGTRGPTVAVRRSVLVERMR